MPVAKLLPEELELLALAAAGELDTAPELSLLQPHVQEALLAVLEARDPQRAVSRLIVQGRTAAAEALRSAVGRVPGLSADEAVRRLAARRALLGWTQVEHELERARRDGADPVGALERVERAACDALASASGREPGQTGTLADFADRYVRLFSERDRHVVPAPFTLVTEALGGWLRGGLHLISGLTGTGKTSVLVQCALHAAEMGFRAHIVSAEMSGEDLVPRALGSYLVRYVDEDGWPVTVARAFRREPPVRSAVAAAMERARDVLGRVSVDARGGLGLRDAVAEFVRQHTIRGVDLLLVDYLQLLAEPNGRSSTREQEVAEAARALKGLAARYRVAVVAAVQLVDPPAWVRGEIVRSPSPAVRESRAAAHAADLILELDPDPQHDANGSAQREVPYVMRLLKSRHSAGYGVARSMVFDRASCRFRESPGTTNAKTDGRSARKNDGRPEQVPDRTQI
jgi:replicative DNA helicase